MEDLTPKQSKGIFGGQTETGLTKVALGDRFEDSLRADFSGLETYGNSPMYSIVYGF